MKAIKKAKVILGIGGTLAGVIWILSLWIIRNNGMNWLYLMVMILGYIAFFALYFLNECIDFIRKENKRK